MSDITELKVALIYGGWSSEREVSLQSGTECAKALGDAGFKNVDVLDLAEEQFASKLAEGGYDVAFVALHGQYGEDGCIQGYLELLNIPYTFSGVCACAVAADKAMTKDIYREHGISTPEGVCLLKGESYDSAQIVEKLGLPLFVKPVVNGSSYGVTRVDSVDTLASAINTAFEYDSRILVESAVIGTSTNTRECIRDI